MLGYMITIKDISCLTVAGWRETREPASMGCNKVHSDLFYSARQHGTALARTNTVKKQEENLGGNEGEWAEKVEIRTRTKSLQWAKHAWLHSDLLQDLTPSLPRCHLKTISKSAKFETLKPFCLVFGTGMSKDFDPNA